MPMCLQDNSQNVICDVMSRYIGLSIVSCYHSFSCTKFHMHVFRAGAVPQQIDLPRLRLSNALCCHKTHTPFEQFSGTHHNAPFSGQSSTLSPPSVSFATTQPGPSFHPRAAVTIPWKVLRAHARSFGNQCKWAAQHRMRRCCSSLPLTVTWVGSSSPVLLRFRLLVLA